MHPTDGAVTSVVIVSLFCLMPNYRRVFIPGGCYFFTVNLLDRGSSLLTDHINALCGAVSSTQRNYPFEIDAMVILPDHLHAI
jgi:putative transposase